jgi:hypothetical protein
MKREAREVARLVRAAIRRRDDPRRREARSVERLMMRALYARAQDLIDGLLLMQEGLQALGWTAEAIMRVSALGWRGMAAGRCGPCGQTVEPERLGLRCPRGHVFHLECSPPAPDDDRCPQCG